VAPADQVGSLPAARHDLRPQSRLARSRAAFGPKPQRRDLPPAGLATAVWTNAEWHSMQPETAASCDLDDPESMADLLGLTRLLVGYCEGT